MGMNILVLKEGDEIQLLIDEDMLDAKDREKFVMTAMPVQFYRRALFTPDGGNPALCIPRAVAVEMAREILELDRLSKKDDTGCDGCIQVQSCIGTGERCNDYVGDE